MNSQKSIFQIQDLITSNKTFELELQDVVFLLTIRKKVLQKMNYVLNEIHR